MFYDRSNINFWNNPWNHLETQKKTTQTQKWQNQKDFPVSVRSLFGIVSKNVFTNRAEAFRASEDSCFVLLGREGLFPNAWKAFPTRTKSFSFPRFFHWGVILYLENFSGAWELFRNKYWTRTVRYLELRNSACILQRYPWEIVTREKWWPSIILVENVEKNSQPLSTFSLSQAPCLGAATQRRASCNAAVSNLNH